MQVELHPMKLGHSYSTPSATYTGDPEYDLLLFRAEYMLEVLKENYPDLEFWYEPISVSTEPIKSKYIDRITVKMTTSICGIDRNADPVLTKCRYGSFDIMTLLENTGTKLVEI